jgi:hypothetical protein
MNTIPTPGTLVNIAGIPADLRAIQQWVLWKPVRAGNKVMKVPVAWYDPTGGNADAQDPANWTTFETAVHVMQRDPRFGIGLVLKGTGIVCIDYDNHAGDDPEAVALGAQYFDMLMREMPTYAEYSISGLGRHAFVWGVLPHGRVTGELDPLNWEIYSQQFIAITGALVPGSIALLAHGQHMIDSWNLPAPVIGAGAVEATRELYRCLTLTDAEVIQTMMARRTAIFNIMNSPMDMSDRSTQFKQIIGDLDKITGDPNQIDRLIRKSPFFGNAYNREKYEQQPKWLARDGHANMLEYWLKQARADNTENIPYMPPLTPERRAELEACLARNSEVQAETNRLHAGAPTPQQLADLEPFDILGKFTPPELPDDVVPAAILEFAKDEAVRLGTDIAPLAFGAVWCAAVASSDKLRLQMTRAGFTQASRLWLQFIGGPSSKKTPIMEAVTSPLEQIDSIAAAKHMKAMEAWNALSPEEQKKNPPPVRKRTYTSNSSTERLQNLLQENPQGIASIHDELAGWLEFDRYSGGSGAASGDKAFWLSAYEGKPYNVDRVGRGSIHIPNLSVAVIGGIQPERLRSIYGNAVDDGLLQRFMTVVLSDERRRMKDLPPGKASKEYGRLIRRLHKMTGQHVEGGTHDAGALFQLTDEAHAARERCFDHYQDLGAMGYVNAKLGSHVGKFAGMLARVTLTYHLIKWAHLIPIDDAPPLPDAPKVPMYVDDATVLQAHHFIMDAVLPHSMSMYSGILEIGKNEVNDVALWILGKGIQSASVGDLRKGVRSLPKNETRDIVAIMEQLEALGWVAQLERGERANAQLVMHVNPKVHELYTAQAKLEQARRDEAKMRIAEVKQYRGKRR